MNKIQKLQCKADEWLKKMHEEASQLYPEEACSPPMPDGLIHPYDPKGLRVYKDGQWGYLHLSEDGEEQEVKNEFRNN